MQQQEIVAQLLSDASHQLAELQKELAFVSECLLGEGFIVQCGGVPLVFHRAIDGQHAKPCGSPLRASRFAKSDAEKIAEVVRNGNGERGAAIHLRDAIAKAEGK